MVSCNIVRLAACTRQAATVPKLCTDLSVIITIIHAMKFYALIQMTLRGLAWCQTQRKHTARFKIIEQKLECDWKRRATSLEVQPARVGTKKQ